MEIEQVKSKLTTSEIQVAVAELWLKHPYYKETGGEQLAKWLDDNKDQVENIFGADDRVYIQMKTPEANRDLVQLIIDEKIADHAQWMKFTDSERWWLLLWWDME